MSIRRNHTAALEEVRLPMRAKLAAAWTSFMFLYIYVDYFALYKPGSIDDILVGVVYKFDITQTWATGALALMGIPILMVMLSTMLLARVSRITNLVVASLYVPVSMYNAAGESWLYFYGLGVVLEVTVLAVILRLAWTWPRRIASPATTAASLDKEPLQTQHHA